MSEKDTHEPEQNVTQPARRTKKKKRGKAGRIVRKTVRTVVVLAVIAGAGLFGLKAYIQKQAESSDNESYSRAVVTRGAMEETVYGTGTTSARNQTNVLAGADGTLTDLRVSVGDEVKAGDILARPIGLYCIARMATFVGVLRKGISVAITRSAALFLPRT